MNEQESRDHSAAIMRLVLDLMRCLSSGLLNDHRFAARAGDLLLVAAVAVGSAEGRPMPAAKLAAYCGMARPTAVRKLNELQSLGILMALPGGRYALSEVAMGSKPAHQAIMAAAARLDAWSRRPVA